MATNLIVVGDEGNAWGGVRPALEAAGHMVGTADHLGSALDRALMDPGGLVLLCLERPDPELFPLLEHHAIAPVLVMLMSARLADVQALLRAGAAEVISHPGELDQLTEAVDRVFTRWALRPARLAGPPDEDEVERFGDRIGASRPMRDLMALARRIAPTDATVLITGETGTGKELVARGIHRHSRRAAGPFVAVNCAAIPDPLLESELFGHTRGSFTGANAARAGLLVRARGGTLFLDEIGDMPLPLQAKLLRVLEDRRVRPVGSDEEIPTDFRLVVATHRDLEQAVREERFREDLFYRLDIARARVPPLRERGPDIMALARLFLAEASDRLQRPVLGMSRRAALRLVEYPWPGNARELRNCMERAAMMAEGELVELADLPDRVGGFSSAQVLVAGSDPEELVTMAEVERRYIRRVMRAVGGHRSEAARILGMDRKTLYRKLRAMRPSDDGA
jgi:two-component system response regulator AtoC